MKTLILCSGLVSVVFMLCVAYVFEERKIKQVKALRYVNPIQTPKILVIVIGELRGNPLVWKSLKTHLLEPYNADLATFLPHNTNFTYLQEIAKYKWEFIEMHDWMMLFDDISKTCNGNWKSFCLVKYFSAKGNIMGGVNYCGHAGASGIMLALRHMLKSHLIPLVDQYDYMVLTRSDFMYFCNHQDFSSFKKEVLYIPKGEEYNGYTDRHLVASSKLLVDSIDLLEEMICNPSVVEMFHRNKVMNIETILKVMWEYRKYEIQSFDRSMFLVRYKKEHSTWSLGTEVEEFKKYKLNVKYPDELYSTVHNCASNKSISEELEILNFSK